MKPRDIPLKKNVKKMLNRPATSFTEKGFTPIKTVLNGNTSDHNKNNNPAFASPKCDRAKKSGYFVNPNKYKPIGLSASKSSSKNLKRQPINAKNRLASPQALKSDMLKVNSAANFNQCIEGSNEKLPNNLQTFSSTNNINQFNNTTHTNQVIPGASDRKQPGGTGTAQSYGSPTQNRRENDNINNTNNLAGLYNYDDNEIAESMRLSDHKALDIDKRFNIDRNNMISSNYSPAPHSKANSSVSRGSEEYGLKSKMLTINRAQYNSGTRIHVKNINSDLDSQKSKSSFQSKSLYKPMLRSRIIESPTNSKHSATKNGISFLSSNMDHQYATLNEKFERNENLKGKQMGLVKIASNKLFENHLEQVNTHNLHHHNQHNNNTNIHNNRSSNGENGRTFIRTNLEGYSRKEAQQYDRDNNRQKHILDEGISGGVSYNRNRNAIIAKDQQNKSKQNIQSERGDIREVEKLRIENVQLRRQLLEQEEDKLVVMELNKLLIEKLHALSAAINEQTEVF